MSFRLILDDEHLFGNPTAEDESEEVFKSYAIERPEITRFLDPSRPLQVARAYKGEGKSALLRLIKIRLAETSAVLLADRFGSAVAPNIQSDASAEWVKAWKQNLIKTAAASLGANIRFAFHDDAISLVEEAERYGFKERSFVTSICQRALSKDTQLPFSLVNVGSPDIEATLKRYAERSSTQVWIIIDDLDENFENTTRDRHRVSAALIAMRQIASEIPEIRFRTSVRPTTWAIIKREYEALSKVDPYVVDMKWSQDDLEQMLARRIQGYIERRTAGDLTKFSNLGRRGQIALAFQEVMPWGRDKEGVDKSKPPIVILSSLSRFRPRWLVELCKVSAARAIKNRHERISFEDIDKELHTFGQRRIDDMIAEFKCQCSKIDLVINSFKNQPERYHTDELVKLIANRVLNQDVRIAGITGKPEPIEIAHFLFQVGFITARADLPDGSYQHRSYSDEPSLLIKGGNIDLGMSWEVPSGIRQALDLKNVHWKMPR